MHEDAAQCPAACLQTSICTELIKRLLEFGPCLAAAAAAVAELDCLASFAAAAMELGYVRPTLTTDDVLLIEGGGSTAMPAVAISQCSSLTVCLALCSVACMLLAPAAKALAVCCSS